MERDKDFWLVEGVSANLSFKLIKEGVGGGFRVGSGMYAGVL